VAKHKERHHQTEVSVRVRLRYSAVGVTGGELIGLQIIGSSAPSLIHTIFYNHTESAASDNDTFDGMWHVYL
jgi:hypothetical protein